MRRLLLAVLASACPLVAGAQTPSSPNVVLNWVADENNSLTVPPGPGAIRLSLGPSILYTISAFSCGTRVTYRVARLTGSPEIELFAKSAGTCNIAIDTDKRRYRLDIVVKEPTPEQPVPAVASVVWG